jgi:hypothetical protein
MKIHPWILAVACCVLAIPVPVDAAGGDERTPADELSRVTLFLLVPPGADASLVGSRVSMDLPPYLWNEFTVRSGKVETSVDGSYRQVGGLSVSGLRMGELELRRVSFRIALARGSAERLAGASRVRVRFGLEALLGTDGEVVIEPGLYALLEAIRQSGKESGQARVLSVSADGPRGFAAVVALR